jgi:hypothetical protein
MTTPPQHQAQILKLVSKQYRFRDDCQGDGGAKIGGKTNRRKPGFIGASHGYVRRKYRFHRERSCRSGEPSVLLCHEYSGNAWRVRGCSRIAMSKVVRDGSGSRFLH